NARHENTSQVAISRHTCERNLLRAQSFAHRDHGRCAGAAVISGEVFESLTAFGRGIDGATDSALAGVIDSAKRHDQVFQAQNWAASGDADDVALVIDLPAFARAGDDDVVFFRVDEHALNTLN